MATPDQIKRCLELPCIGETQDGSVMVTLKSRQVFTRELFQADPVGCLRHATYRMLDEVQQAAQEKLRVLDEIERGTNRYKLKPGGFSNVGIAEEHEQAEQR
ncbi:MAG: hypothetical protein K2X87_09380 [Gemmataceae bacterium]|nr:hypothetical protein [Gemmataceae bacterium]